MVGLEELLRQRLAAAFASVAGMPVDPAVRRSQHADYQSDAALALSRTLAARASAGGTSAARTSAAETGAETGLETGTGAGGAAGGGTASGTGAPASAVADPRSIAERVVAAAQLDDICATVEVSGPGFINLTVANGTMARLLAEMSGDERLGVAPSSEPETIAIDYSAPNAAKEMHVGHLRSTIIGDAAVRLLEWQGHTVIRQNHIGEWGTPFGMLIEHMLDIGESEAAHELSVGDLTGFYQAARRGFDSDEDFKDRARRRVVALQSGDPVTRRLWESLVGESKKYFATVYGRLRVRLTDDDYVGESFYNDQLQDVVDELDSAGLLRISEGAICVFPAGYTNREGNPLPLIVRKGDGGYGYAATDLATIRHRLRALHATRLLYVVGLPQHQHLEMVFETAREAGWLAPPARAEHIGHGSILGTDGKMLRTRQGVSVKLVDLLDEAVTRASAVIEEKNPDLDAAQRAEVAQAVGIGAVKYADLSTDRVKDYVFDLDRMLAFDGNTAPYLQYAQARIRSIFRRAGRRASPDEPEIAVQEPAERALALELLAFGSVVQEVAGTLEFHRLAHYLYGLASTFTTFYERCPILKAEEAVRASRLALCDLTARTLTVGLGLLGIDAPEQM